jgi:hypothetical protein
MRDEVTYIALEISRAASASPSALMTLAFFSCSALATTYAYTNAFNIVQISNRIHPANLRLSLLLRHLLILDGP